MHDFLHVEHLFFFFYLPDLPSDFKYFVKNCKYMYKLLCKFAL